MSLNIDKLENVKQLGNLTVARCPACAQDGHDKKGEHLSIDQNGRFGCVVYPGESGRTHRKKIYELTGQKQNRITITVKLAYVRADRKVDEIIENDILGQLGRAELTRSHRNTNTVEP